MRRFVFFAIVLSASAAALALACTDQTDPSFASAAPLVDSGALPEDATSTGTDTGVDDAPSAVDAGTGSGTIGGAVSGSPFTTVMSAFWIGMPDNPATTAVYLIGKQATCADLATSGWAHTITAGTQIFEMIMTSATPVTAKYTASSATSPPVGSAEIQYIVAAPARNETRATAGSIDLTTLTAGALAIGTFDVQFGAGDAGDAGANSLTGSFHAAYCAGGHEP